MINETDAKMVARESQVENALKRLSFYIENAEIALQSLENRISDILIPPIPDIDGDRFKPQDVVLLAMRINDLSARTGQLVYSIEAISKRVEL